MALKGIKSGSKGGQVGSFVEWSIVKSRCDSQVDENFCCNAEKFMNVIGMSHVNGEIGELCELESDNRSKCWSWE